ncbi:MAG: EFR1 family ferrodoxin [Bacteroidales bacterium]|nr:EFR1 family ferrodoxin [Bacteroidales bacterium]
MPNPERITIYYFTGTGNSAKVAEWFARVAECREIPSQSINIGKMDRLHIGKPANDALIIFVSPIHGFNYPPAMLHFIMRFPKGSNRIVLMNTRAGMKIGNFVTPGLTGIAFLLSGMILKLKGYHIQGMAPIDLPSNWLSLHPALNKPTVSWIHKKNKKRVCLLAEELLNGKRSFKNWYENIWDIPFAPVAILYYLFGRFLFAKTFYPSGACDNCGVCIEQCPVKAIKSVNNRPFWTYNCESCMHCMSQCPKKAIHTGHGYVAAILAFSSIIVWNLILDPVFDLEFILGPVAGFLLKTGVFFLILTLGYRLVHSLLPYKFVRILVECTSLTKYKFWGNRYKALKDSDFE